LDKCFDPSILLLFLSFVDCLSKLVISTLATVFLELLLPLLREEDDFRLCLLNFFFVSFSSFGTSFELKYDVGN
jgi:hypothetical protein